MIARALVILHVAAAQLSPGEAQARPFPGPPVVDAVLAEQRGGIRLPNGIDVNLSIDTVTAIDGRIVLQTVTRITEGAPVVTAYAPEDGSPVALANDGNGRQQGFAPPRITYDRQNGLTVTTGRAIVPVTLTTGEGGNAPEDTSGLHAIDAGHSVTTPNGLVQVLDGEGIGGVELQGEDIRILHLTRNAVGSVIVNTGSDRAIDTHTNVSIDLRNAGPAVLGSAMLRAEDVALGALASRF
jgi:hypothetical protein